VIGRDDILGVVLGNLWMFRFSRVGNLWVFRGGYILLAPEKISCIPNGRKFISSRWVSSIPSSIELSLVSGAYTNEVIASRSV
jgi:hypothetical protein